MTDQPSFVSLASSADVELGPAAAPLDVPLSSAQIETIVRRALDLDTSDRSLCRIVKPTDWVVLKPNIVTSPTHKCSYWHDGTAHPGQVTDLRVIRSIIAWLLERCPPRRLSIAEGGAEWQRGSGENGEDGWTVHFPEFDDLSYTGIVEAFGRSHPGIVDIVDLNEDEIRFLPVPDPHGTGIGALQRVGQELRPPERYGRWDYVPDTGQLREGYHIPATVLDCDVLVSVPALKTHSCATTLAIKNYVGILPTHPSGVVKKSNVHDGDFQKGFVDLFCYHPADYSILEGFWSTEGNGPQWGENLHHNIVVAGADPVAVDAVGSELMGFNAADIDYLHYAAAKGFGTFDPDRIRLVGTPRERAFRRFSTASGRKGIPFTARGHRSWMIRLQESDEGRLLESQERYIDLARAYAAQSPAQAWASVTVDADDDLAAVLWASADGALRVELNGATVAQRRDAAPHCLGEFKVDVALHRGPNDLLVHVERGDSGLGFTAILCDGDGYGLRGIRYAAATASAPHRSTA